ncbi:MAG: hypothetical protein R6W70_11285 [bacterium]
MYSFIISRRGISLLSLKKKGGVYSTDFKDSGALFCFSEQEVLKAANNLTPEDVEIDYEKKDGKLSYIISHDRTEPMPVFIAGPTSEISLEHAVKAVYDTPVIILGAYSSDVSSVESLLGILLEKKPLHIMVASGEDSETSRNYSAIMETVLFYKKNISPETVIIFAGKKEPDSWLNRQLVSQKDYYYAHIDEGPDRYRQVHNKIMDIYTLFCLKNFSEKSRQSFLFSENNISKAVAKLSEIYMKNIVICRLSGSSAFISGSWLKKKQPVFRNRFFTPSGEDILRFFKNTAGRDADTLINRIFNADRGTFETSKETDGKIFNYFFRNITNRFFISNRSRKLKKNKNDLGSVVFGETDNHEPSPFFDELILTIPSKTYDISDESIVKTVARNINIRKSLKIILDKTDAMCHAGAIFNTQKNPSRDMIRSLMKTVRTIGYIIRPLPSPGISGPIDVKIKDSETELEYSVKKGSEQVFSLKGDITVEAMRSGMFYAVTKSEFSEKIDFFAEKATVIVDNK